jgi:hypothetical protein
MPTRTQAALAAALLLLLAGCAGSTGGEFSADSSGVSDVKLSSNYGEPTIQYNESADSGNVTIESPTGETINKQSAATDYPNKRLSIPREPGNYTVRLVQNGNVVDSKTVRVERAKPRVNITANWTRATLPQALVTVRNAGDLPTNASAEISHAGEQLSESFTQGIAGGEDYTFRMTGLYGSLYEASDGGTVNLRASIETDERTIRRTISHDVASANLEFEYMRPNWQSNELKTVVHRVRNTGDVTAELGGELTVNGETAVGSLYGEVEGGESKEFTIDHADLIASDYLYKAESGSNTVELTLRYKGGEVSTTTADDFESATGEISGVTASWSSIVGGSDVRLSSADFTVQNTGGVGLEYDSVRVEIGGQTASDDLYSAATIEPGSQTQDSMRPGYDNRPQVAPGEHELTITLLDGGRTVAETTTTVTAEAP